MICFPNAKINIGLYITGKRPDGYHTIESIFYPIPLIDALEVVVSEKTSFTQTGFPLESAPEDNLVMKAYDLMNRKCKLPPLAIYLKKAIPPGAGLGGGSADAAFMLQLLKKCYNQADTCTANKSQSPQVSYEHPISENELHTMAESIGADCPFFLHNTPVIATGTGSVFQSTELNLQGYNLLIVKPSISIATKEAYAMVTPQKPDFSLDQLSSIPVHNWKNVLRNDFEPRIFEKYPVIGKIKDTLYSMGAEYASMSGSGSAVYGLFKTNIDSFAFADCFVWKGMIK